MELLPQRNPEADAPHHLGVLNRSHVKPIVAVLIGLSIAGYFLTQRAAWRTWFPPKGLFYGDIAQWLRTNARFNDVFVSSDIEIQTYPPQALAVARKVVWKFDTAAQLRSFLGRLPPQAVVHLIRDTTRGACDESKIGERIATVGKYSIVRSQPSMQALRGCMYSVGEGK
jgi:hypothetical protein